MTPREEAWDQVRKAHANLVASPLINDPRRLKAVTKDALGMMGQPDSDDFLVYSQLAALFTASAEHALLNRKP